MIEINKIYNEDCREGLKRIPDDSVDLVITSPPYNFDAGSGLGNKYGGNGEDSMTPGEYYTFLSSILEDLIRVSCLVFFNIQMIAGNKDSLLKLMGNYRSSLKEIIVWNKKTAQPAINRGVLNSQFEFIIVFGKNNRRTFDKYYFDRGSLSNLWDINKNRNNITTSHSAIMPIELAKKIVLNFTKKEDVVLDPFMGTGTTALACMDYNRNYIGFEKDPAFFNICNERINNHKITTNTLARFL